MYRELEYEGQEVFEVLRIKDTTNCARGDANIEHPKGGYIYFSRRLALLRVLALSMKEDDAKTEEREPYIMTAGVIVAIVIVALIVWWM